MFSDLGIKVCEEDEQGQGRPDVIEANERIGGSR